MYVYIYICHIIYTGTVSSHDLNSQNLKSFRAERATTRRQRYDYYYYYHEYYYYDYHMIIVIIVIIIIVFLFLFASLPWVAGA